MTPVTSFAGKTVAVFGLGGSGLASCHALKAGGAEVIACDDSADKMADAARAGFITADLRTVSWTNFAALVLTPGVPLTHPAPHWTVLAAREAGVEVIGDIELFFRERALRAPEARVIAITGTNGKSTTTALMAHLLREAGHDVQMGGNIGTAILSLEPPVPNRTYVIEMSSYQIDLTPFFDRGDLFSVGILLNITPDHIDRHGTLENYAAVKARLVRNASLAVVGVDDEYCARIADGLRDRGGRYEFVSTRKPIAPGVYAVGSKLYSGAPDHRAGLAAGQLVTDLAGIGSLRGEHNAQNAAAAVAVCLAIGVSLDVLQKGLRSFPGLAHRMEQVGHLGTTLFVNDSKGTNADAAAKALSSFTDIFWIAGGKAKEGGIAPLAEYFPRVKKAYLIGEAANDFSRTLEGKLPYEISVTLDVAVANAARDAAEAGLPAPVVLLSPACASFDQFRNFEIRGDRFRDLVLALDGIKKV